MLKKKCLEQSSVNSNFGWTYQSHKETSDGIESLLVDNQSRTHIVRSKYLVGADGGGSRVRKHSGIKMLGGPLYVFQ
jgi:2-polyprenyl-6-methoxyphenol hydroxylase-like FAD-dependent oxidoreductase